MVVQTINEKENRMTRELLSVDEFCIAANVGTTKAYQIFNSGEIKVVKLGRKTLIPKAEMTRWIDSLALYKAEATEVYARSFMRR